MPGWDNESEANRMTRNAEALLVLGVVAVIVLSCTNAGLPDMPDTGVPNSALNNEVRLVAPPSINSFRIGKEVNLLLVSQSENQVWFEADLGTRMFILRPNERKWIEVFEMTDTFPNLLPPSLSGAPQPTQFILGPHSQGLKQLGFAVLPRIENEYRPVTLMVATTGSVYRNGSVTQEEVGAYIVIHLVPRN